ncbi:HIT family protein [Chromobacterium sp.]|uniref:HIT family protein n=1 Tax=Chromobacterium sp. TaxID=306190 RepID=UPI0035AED7A8
MDCELCQAPAGQLLHEDERLRVLLVDEAGYPGFCRVIWKAHVREMSDLSDKDRLHLLDWVQYTEAALRHILKPAKINLASLGNMVPHLHWHVIPRFEDDAHFPAPIWAAARRDGAVRHWPDLAGQLRSQLADAASHCWLNYQIQVTQVPDGLEGADLACYRFFAESGLAWPVDGVDADGRHWLALRRVDGNGASSVETLRLDAGSYRLVPGVPSYQATLLR